MDNFSLSPITHHKFELPKSSSDKKTIDQYLKNNKLPIVAIQGLGFVGAAMSLVVANSKKYKVIGVDRKTPNDFWKIASINNGITPLASSDPKVKTYLKNAMKLNSIYATYDEYAYSTADIIIIDINLDVKKNYSDQLTYDVDLTPFKNAIKTIGKNCKNNCLILVETTVPPGTCDLIVKPIIESELRKRKLTNNVKIGHSYERVMPGDKYIDSIENFYRVYSGIDKKSEIATKNFLESIINTSHYPLTLLKGTRATETAKVLENSYRALNIAFIEEWERFAQLSQIDLNEVISAIKIRPTHSNLMRPGLGVGGYCLTKDPLLASWSSEQFFNGNKLEFSVRGVEVNDFMPETSFNFIKQKCKSLKNKNVLIFGVSYLGNVGDSRYSPVELLFKRLRIYSKKISLHDFYLNKWEELNLKIDYQKINQINFSNYDVAIFCTNHAAYRNNSKLTNELIKNNIQIFDLNLCLDQNDFNRKNYTIYSLGNHHCKELK